MPRVRMTAKWVQSVKPRKGKQTDYYDDKTRMDGAYFGLRISQAGAKQWFVMYRKTGKLRRFKIGRYYNDDRQQRERPDHLPLSGARDAAAKKLAEIVDGDPAKEKANRKQAPTVAALVEDYIENYAKPKKKTWERDAQLLNNELVPEYGSVRVGDLDRWAVEDLLMEIAETRPVWSNRFLEVGRKAYNWGMTKREYHKHIEYNPFANQDRQPEVARDTVLKPRELKTVWRAYTELGNSAGLAFKLLLLTAQRRSEVLTMRWEDMEGDWWTIPAGFTKSGRSHRVPLTDTVTKLLGDQKESGWVFPSPRKSTGKPIVHLDKAHHAIREATGIDFRIHDLRRTVATNMAGPPLSVPRLHIAMLLNHAVPGVTGKHYDLYQYDDEKRAALEKWDKRLREIVT